MVWMNTDRMDGFSPENNAMQAALNRDRRIALPKAAPKENVAEPDVLAQQRVASGQVGKTLRNSDT